MKVPMDASLSGALVSKCAGVKIILAGKLFKFTFIY